MEIDSLLLSNLFSQATVEKLAEWIKRNKIQTLKGYEISFVKQASIVYYVYMDSIELCYDKQMALKYSIIYCKPLVFKYLLSRVRYKEQLDYIYSTGHGSSIGLLELCSLNGYIDGVKHLIKDGANVNLFTVNKKGETLNLIMSLCDNLPPNETPSENKLKLFTYLIDKIDVNSVNTYGQTALMFACRSNALNYITLLIEKGADESILDMNGLSCKEYFYKK